MIDNVRAFVFPAAFALLPGVMDTAAARAMLLAIGLQESGFAHRTQVGGPARGFWQFEQAGGTAGVLAHPTTMDYSRIVCGELVYPPDAETCYRAIADNDVLACCFARLLLWTLPDRLPPRGHADRAWAQYLSAWRPGKPRPDDWPANYTLAWAQVEP